MKIRRHAALATALLAVGAPLLAACGSSGSNNAAASPTPTLKLPAADCAAIAPLAQGTIAQLTPLAAMPQAQAKAQMDQYITQLKQTETKLIDPTSKADMDALITALQQSEASGNQQQAAMSILPAITKIVTDCGGAAGS